MNIWSINIAGQTIVHQTAALWPHDWKLNPIIVKYKLKLSQNASKDGLIVMGQRKGSVSLRLLQLVQRDLGRRLGNLLAQQNHEQIKGGPLGKLAIMVPKNSTHMGVI